MRGFELRPVFSLVSLLPPLAVRKRTAGLGPIVQVATSLTTALAGAGDFMPYL